MRRGWKGTVVKKRAADKKRKLCANNTEENFRFARKQQTTSARPKATTITCPLIMPGILQSDERKYIILHFSNNFSITILWTKQRSKKWETMYRKEDEQSSAVRVVGSSIEIVNAGAHSAKGRVRYSRSASQQMDRPFFPFRNWWLMPARVAYPFRNGRMMEKPIMQKVVRGIPELNNRKLLNYSWYKWTTLGCTKK